MCDRCSHNVVILEVGGQAGIPAHIPLLQGAEGAHRTPSSPWGSLRQSTEVFKRLKPGVTERTGEG